jgi:hypothetical protein
MTGFLMTETAIFGQESYLNELLPGTESSFQHLNLESSKITGKSHFRYEILIKEGTQFVVEKNENTKSDGEVFTRKTLWFDADSGIPKWYEEEDLRKEFRITNSYTGQIMHTRLLEDGKILEFKTNLSAEDAVPFEVVIFFSAKIFKTNSTDQKFSLYTFYPTAGH